MFDQPEACSSWQGVNVSDTQPGNNPHNCYVSWSSALFMMFLGCLCGFFFFLKSRLKSRNVGEGGTTARGLV